MAWPNERSTSFSSRPVAGHRTELFFRDYCIAANAIVREPQARTGLWSLVQSIPGTVLVTGDLALHRHPPAGFSILLPREFAKRIGA